MIHNPRPTRAEVTDIANAVIDGTDALMLSGETAAGEYPIEAVKMMAKVAQHADDSLPDRSVFDKAGPISTDVTEIVAQATVEMARAMKATAIICATTSGSTARMIAKYRPLTHLIAATPNEETYRRLALTWGVRPLLIGKVYNSDQMMEETITAVMNQGIVKLGNRVILTAGVPVNNVGNTNLIRVHVVGEPVTPNN